MKYLVTLFMVVIGSASMLFPTRTAIRRLLARFGF
jgi:hypothetical protein